MKAVYTIYCYEDREVKDVFATREEAEAWISENRVGNEDICRIERWSVDFTKKKMEDR